MTKNKSLRGAIVVREFFGKGRTKIIWLRARSDKLVQTFPRREFDEVKKSWNQKYLAGMTPQCSVTPSCRLNGLVCNTRGRELRPRPRVLF